jgi:hypothetical protein
VEIRLATLECVMPSGGCPTCRDAEAKAFLSKLRTLLAEMGG